VVTSGEPFFFHGKVAGMNKELPEVDRLSLHLIILTKKPGEYPDFLVLERSLFLFRNGFPIRRLYLLVNTELFTNPFCSSG
jgi:hypothetical protein